VGAGVAAVPQAARIKEAATTRAVKRNSLFFMVKFLLLRITKLDFSTDDRRTKRLVI
jgi:hypothetical protein